MSATLISWHSGNLLDIKFYCSSSLAANATPQFFTYNQSTSWTEDLDSLIKQTIIVFIYSPTWQKSRIDQGPHNFFHVSYRPFHLTLKVHIFWGFHNYLYVFTGKPMVVTFISKLDIKTRIFVILKLRASQKDCFS